jgi:hypothetical protein
VGQSWTVTAVILAVPVLLVLLVVAAVLRDTRREVRGRKREQGGEW